MPRLVSKLYARFTHRSALNPTVHVAAHVIAPPAPVWVTPSKVSTRMAVWLLVAASFFWGTAGVISRQVVYASGVEITFWRSAIAALSIVVIMTLWRGAAYWLQVRWRDSVLWTSGILWAMMMTAFMLAMSFTSVANVLIMQAFGPVFTALASRFILKLRLPLYTWCSIAAAVLGIVYMYATNLSLNQPREIVGVVIAGLIPVGYSVQLLLMHREKQRPIPESLETTTPARRTVQAQAGRDMLPAICIGAVLSAMCCAPFAMPLQADLGDMVWLSLLGFLQLAVPCTILVIAARVLNAPEVSLLAQLETIFGILLAWWGAGELPTREVWIGGSIVLAALAFNEMLALRNKEH